MKLLKVLFVLAIPVALFSCKDTGKTKTAEEEVKVSSTDTIPTPPGNNCACTDLSLFDFHIMLGVLNNPAPNNFARCIFDNQSDLPYQWGWKSELGSDSLSILFTSDPSVLTQDGFTLVGPAETCDGPNGKIVSQQLHIADFNQQHPGPILKINVWVNDPPTKKKGRGTVISQIPISVEYIAKDTNKGQ